MMNMHKKQGPVATTIKATAAPYKRKKGSENHENDR
jgi:hypothetical protein